MAAVAVLGLAIVNLSRPTVFELLLDGPTPQERALASEIAPYIETPDSGMLVEYWMTPQLAMRSRVQVLRGNGPVDLTAMRTGDIIVMTPLWNAPRYIQRVAQLDAHPYLEPLQRTEIVTIYAYQAPK